MPGRRRRHETVDVGWPAVLLALLVSHMAGDFLLQTEWQAVNKGAAISGGNGRRALLRHVATYMMAFLPALRWIGSQRGTRRAAEVGLLVGLPHLVVDEGWLVQTWLRAVKGASEPETVLAIAVDQTFHVVCLFGAALAAGA
jgi:hypothetical protein